MSTLFLRLTLDNNVRIRKEYPQTQVWGIQLYIFLIKMSSKKIKISIFCSIFKGGKYIDHYLKDITNQTIFEECELILVDAN